MGFFKETPPPFKHQALSSKFFASTPVALDFSDPGTGKTRSVLDYLKAEVLAGNRVKALVLAPKSILQPAWGNDINTFTPELTYAIATANNRQEAFDKDAHIYITNHDAVRWLVRNNIDFSQFTHFIVDELTAYKNRTAQRSKSAAKIASKIERRIGMTGTPNSNGVEDLWHQAKLIDSGARLGTAFWPFRNTVSTPCPVFPGGPVNWETKPGALEAVGDLLSDITVRHKFEECIDIPENFTTDIIVQLAPRHRTSYDVLLKTSLLEIKEQEINAINAGALATKLAQMASGAVYDAEGKPAIVNDDRSLLIADLVAQRQQCLIAFNWRHQRDGIATALEAKGISYQIIDGTRNDAQRIETVRAFQNSEIKVILAHPQSAGHGLTLTKGTSTIWASPSHNAEHFQQFNKRIYRAGQTERTETVRIVAENTTDAYVYENLGGKLNNMELLLLLMKNEQNPESM
jgi:SNF2 family DNA or RNA helicase